MNKGALPPARTGYHPGRFQTNHLRRRKRNRPYNLALCYPPCCEAEKKVAEGDDDDSKYTSTSIVIPASHLRFPQLQQRPANGGFFLSKTTPKATQEQYLRLTHHPPLSTARTRAVSLSLFWFLR